MSMNINGREIRNPVARALAAVAGILIALAVIALVVLVVLPSVFITVAIVLLVVAVVVLVTVPVAFLWGIAHPPVKGSGIESTDTRDVGTFHGIAVSGALTVDVVCGEAESVTIAGDDNLLELVETRVEDGVLRIRTWENIRPRVPLRVRVAASSLDEVASSGANIVSVIGLEADRLAVKDSGAGKLTLAGKCREAAFRLSGAGKVDAAELICEGIGVRLSGAAEASLHATERLKLHMSGAGKVRCQGGPSQVEQHTSGAATVELT